MFKTTLDVRTILVILLDEMQLGESSVNYCLKRLSSEGLPFVTETLPKFSAAVLKSLELGYFDRSELTNFRWKGRALTVFRELTDSIFDSFGLLLVNPCPVAIYRIRQFSDYLYKLALDISADTKDNVREFIQTDEDIRTFPFDDIFIDEMRKNIESSYNFPSVDKLLSDFRPRFGPGTYSTGSTYNTHVPFYEYKQTVSSRLVPKRFHGIVGAFRPYPGAGKRCSLHFGDDTSLHSQLLFVPKDSRGPRAIVREPLQRLSLQMSFFDFFSSFLQKETVGRINFTDQSVNQKLAQQGSKDGSYATLDLKHASDRVSLSVVKKLTANIPVLRYFIKERSAFVELPSGELHRLAKLAGMGSGLTFTFLAFVCHVSIATEISKRSAISYKQASKLVYVYGDDIVVPAHFAPMAKQALAKIGLMVNTKKSFCSLHLNRKSYFRESCGGDYFGGNDVSIVRAKFASSNLVYRNCGKNHFLDLSGDNAANQINSHCKELVKSGLLKLANYYYSKLEKSLGKLPSLSNFDSSIIGRYTRVSVEHVTDKTGTYANTRVWTPVPVVGEFPEQDDYRYAANSLRQRQVDWDSCFYSQEVGVPQYSIAVPRAVKLVRQKISMINLV